MSLRRVALAVLAALWALLVVLASNGPDDVQARANAWLSLPVIKWLPTAVLEFASSRAVIGVTFLAIGIVIGRWWKGRQKAVPSYGELYRMMLQLADNIERFGWDSSRLDTLNGQVHLVEMKLRRLGLDFPTVENGYKSLDDNLPYLCRVAPLLGAGELEAARALAKLLSAPKGANRAVG